LTVCSQRTSTDSICFSKDQAKKILKDLKRLDFCDSITINQERQIINFKAVLHTDSTIIAENNKRLLEVTKTLNKANLKVKVLKKISFFGVPIAFGGGIIAALVLLK